jgi:hypothetical protein
MGASAVQFSCDKVSFYALQMERRCKYGNTHPGASFRVAHQQMHPELIFSQEREFCAAHGFLGVH